MRVSCRNAAFVMCARRRPLSVSVRFGGRGTTTACGRTETQAVRVAMSAAAAKRTVGVIGRMAEKGR
jgi:hypothetical protein